MLFQRQSLALLGGWDERFLGWGGEDNAMDIKDQRAGLRGVMLKGSPGFHLAHRRVGATIARTPITATTSHCSNNSARCPMRPCAGCAKSPRSSPATPTCIARWKSWNDASAKVSPQPAASAAAAAPSILAECNLMIGTPAYGGMVHIDYLRCLFEYTSAGIRYELNTIGNESLITRGRNAILANFHVRTELTHLLFLDADTTLPAVGLIRMLNARTAVIGAPVGLKGSTRTAPHLERRPLRRRLRLAPESGECRRRCPLAVARICDALVKDAIDHGRAYERMSTMVGNTDTEVYYDVFRVGVQAALSFGDFWVCRRLGRSGSTC